MYLFIRIDIDFLFNKIKMSFTKIFLCVIINNRESDRMEEEKQTSVSIWHRDLNLVFVYVVIFLAGIVVVSIMTTILNNKVNEINNGSIYTDTNYTTNM